MSERIFKHMDDAFAKADEAFAHADKAFDELDKLDEAQWTKASKDQVHRLKFATVTKGDRWRLCRRFLGLAWSALWHGEATLVFKQK